jgi:hypothetical protein
MLKKNKLLLERHSDLLNTLVRCRIKIEEREDPTVLDIMTDIRALPGIVTVRQTLKVTDVVTSYGHRLIELNVSYIPAFIEEKDKFMTVVKSLKKVEGIDMVKVIEHDDDSLNRQLQKRPLII